MESMEPLRADHAAEVLAFEQANRAYFTSSISDRGQAFFDEFDERFAAMLDEQQAGGAAFHVLVIDDGSVLGRFNLYNIHDGNAEVGYRIAQHVAGRGVATAALQQLCEGARTRHGLRTLTASTSHHNAASQRVLAKTGFVTVGPANPADLGGKTGNQYRLDLTLASELAGSEDVR